MPELPEVETVMRGLAGALAGRRLARVEQRRPDLRFPLPERFAARLQGRRILGFGRRAKYILAELDDGVTWLSHLGMSGRMMLGEGPAPEPERHDHLIVETDDGQHLIYRDARRFGFMDLIEAGGLEDHPRLAGLGIEPLGPELTGRRLRALFAGRRVPLKAALLDQRRIAGLGNIYVCEALNRARLHPDRPSGSLSAAEARALAKAVRGTLEEAVAAGGSALGGPLAGSGGVGDFQPSPGGFGRRVRSGRSGSMRRPARRGWSASPPAPIRSMKPKRLASR
ncbi:MAG: bifunctional DNA-formamidopyrimidine glycosylase/DNA-(apurinic or apyrimidinic site) lyase [Alphaproteobacteria bacterium]|nr:bifunctional DNA-formamidopyrimidine glycosylase/DNA-(apurinic or apyrimidinic site) lyase [Alphaproteobacteria bacterium]